MDSAAPHSTPPTHLSLHEEPVSNAIAAPAVSARRFPCRVCKREFSSSTNRIRHERKQHSTASTAAKMASFSTRPASVNALQLHAQTCRGAPAAVVVGEPVSESNPPIVPMRKRTLAEDESCSPSFTPRSNTNRAGEHSLTISGSDSESESSSDSDSSASDSSDLEFSETSANDLKRSRRPPTLITDETLDAISDGFLRWLEQGPETTVEQMVKGRRMITEAQLAPIRLNLRFLLNTINALVPSEQAPISLSSTVQVDSIRAVMSHLEQRRVGPARIYALSLLLKKVCVYLCSKQSSTSMLYIAPQTLPSWQLIDSHCNHSSRKRKLRQRDRLVLHTSQATITSEELAVVVRGCLAVLAEVMDRCAGDQADGSLGSFKTDAKRFTECFITALFALLLAPRQQVLREMTMESMVRPAAGGNYVIRMSAERTKVGQPVLLRVPDVLTKAIDFYLCTVLPDGHTGHVFLQRRGEPRRDFSSATRAVTQQLIGRAINAHQFRHCVATLFHGRKDATDMMMRQLADTMNHDPQAQAQFYVRQHRLEAQEKLQGMLMEQVRMA